MLWDEGSSMNFDLDEDLMKKIKPSKDERDKRVGN
jgi:hypothetical protein